MNIPTLVLMTEYGAYIWEGSALEFCRANHLGRDDVADMCATLRGQPNMPPEPWTIGGGAAPLMYVLLSE